MTCIAWDGKTLAADKLAVYGTLRRTVVKIRRAGDCLVGLAGEAQWFGALAKWVEDGRDPATYPAHQASKDDMQSFLVIEPSGQILLYERSPYPVKFEGTQIAIGCGRDFATAAMHLGHSAVAAVKLACELDAFCGNGIDTLTLTLPLTKEQEAQHAEKARLDDLWINGLGS